MRRELVATAAVLLALPLLGAAPGSSAVEERPALTAAAAARMVEAAEQRARELKVAVVIAVVDEAGYLLYLKRLDGALLPSLEVAEAKARSAALFRQPTRGFQDLAERLPGRALAIPDAMPIGGGLPVVVDGGVIGGVGVSGASIADDESIAEAALEALTAMLEEPVVPEEPEDGG